VSDAVEQLLTRVTAEDVQLLDQKVQAMIRQQFTGLRHVCQSSANVLKNVEGAMQREAEPVAETRLVGTNVVDMYLERYESEQQAMDGIARAFDEAAPMLMGPRDARRAEVQVLAAPPGPSEERFRDLARRALPETNLVAAASADDIALYRELPRLPISALEQLGSAGLEAYRQLTTVENFTPHSRTDIPEWEALPPR
jgi:hypothetical protein